MSDEQIESTPVIMPAESEPMPDKIQMQERTAIPPKRRRRLSTAEFYVALEGLLPFAEIEIEWLADYVASFPDDEDHAKDVLRVRHGTEALELARRLIAGKSYHVRRKERALREQGASPAADVAQGKGETAEIETPVPGLATEASDGR